jgi:lysosomal Pro-X carboxypeptidase
MVAKLNMLLAALTALLAFEGSLVQAIGSHPHIKFFSNKFNQKAKENFQQKLLESEGAMSIKEFNARVDHFNASNEDTFPMRYILDTTHYDPKNPGPILFYAGNEGAIEGFYDNSGFVVNELSQKMGGLVVFAEHRFYGESFPDGGMTRENLKFLSVKQVMLDYVTLLDYLRELFPEQQQEPAFLFGGSYGGMLAAWIRMKYPHKFQGAIASSAPILWFKGATDPSAYTEVASNVFKKQLGGEDCFNGLKYGFFDLENLKNDQTQWKAIEDTFVLCDPIKAASDVDTLIATLSDGLGTMAMVNYPYETNFVAPLPAWPMNVSC